MSNTYSKKVSIVLPVYNGEDNVSYSIESVLCQTYKNLELIIVNDCSTDNTLEILEKYASKDERIRIVNNPYNLKLPRSLNIGFENATGEYYTWTSDDNLYKKNAIERMVKTLEKTTNIDMVYADFTFIDANGNEQGYLKTGKTKELLNRNPIGACFLYTRQIAQKVGLYDPNLFLAEDYDYWIRIWREGKLKHMSENLYYYRRHAGSLTETKKNLVGMQTYKVLEKNFLFLYSMAETRRERNAFINRMLKWIDGHDKTRIWKMFLKINKICVWKDKLKEGLRSTVIWKWLSICKEKLKSKLRGTIIWKWLRKCKNI